MAVHIQVFDEMGIGYGDTFTVVSCSGLPTTFTRSPALKGMGSPESSCGASGPFVFKDQMWLKPNAILLINFGTFTAKMCSIHAYNIHTGHRTTVFIKSTSQRWSEIVATIFVCFNNYNLFYLIILMPPWPDGRSSA